MQLIIHVKHAARKSPLTIVKKLRTAFAASASALASKFSAKPTTCDINHQLRSLVAKQRSDASCTCQSCNNLFSGIKIIGKAHEL